MANLSVAILGLGRIGTSAGLALRRYMKKGGKHTFEIVGHDISSHNEKQAKKLGAVDDIESKLHRAVADCDLVLLTMPYEDLEKNYQQMADSIRDGCVVLDASPIKHPSLDIAKKYLSSEQHMVGITPIFNPRYLFDAKETIEQAEEDLFDNSAILLTPAASCSKAAVDLAFNFCVVLGSKPRFLDPHEHDAMLGYTEGLPSLMGVSLFYYLMHQDNWQDLQWFTNPNFGVLTRPLNDRHPDDLRDEWMQNRDVLGRALDGMIETLQGVRGLLADGDKSAIEDFADNASQQYEQWINHRYNADWDNASKAPKYDSSYSLLGSMFGNNMAKRIRGEKDDD
ncbi:MAG: prephenate dehydrogenase [Aggregatilineales bacterium]